GIRNPRCELGWTIEPGHALTDSKRRHEEGVEHGDRAVSSRLWASATSPVRINTLQVVARALEGRHAQSSAKKRVARRNGASQARATAMPRLIPHQRTLTHPQCHWRRDPHERNRKHPRLPYQRHRSVSRSKPPCTAMTSW